MPTPYQLLQAISGTPEQTLYSTIYNHLCELHECVPDKETTAQRNIFNDAYRMITSARTLKEQVYEIILICIAPDSFLEDKVKPKHRKEIKKALHFNPEKRMMSCL